MTAQQVADKPGVDPDAVHDRGLGLLLRHDAAVDGEGRTRRERRLVG